MFTSPFGNSNETIVTIQEDADVIFVADMFVEDYVGGAELTTEALISSANDIQVQKIRSSQLGMSQLKAGVQKHWVFGNFSGVDPNLIPSIIGNLSYSVLEYDYKFCQYRSIEKHENETGSPCDCHEQLHGKMISAFLHGARSIWWMSEDQEKRYIERFPFLAKNDSVVLSSVFDDTFFAYVNQVDIKPANERNGKWLVLGSPSWIKGADDALLYCDKHNLDHEVVWNITHGELLKKLAESEGFVYLPKGGDTCPRMVIEARALGCELVMNDHVQHAKEEWFTGSYEDMLAYLYAARERFWRAIKSIHSHVPSLSGYITVRNADQMNYPWRASVLSMLGFCHEVVVVDGGSNDGTWEKLQELAKDDERIVIDRIEISPDDPSFAYKTDGKLKAHARSLCTSDFCWQMDADEIVHEEDYEKVHQLLRAFPTHCDIVSLPVIEYWGGDEKVRMDINPWKWRLSRNLSHITQGIPGELVREDEDGNIYAAWGTDTCDYIHSETLERLPHLGFYNEQAHSIRVSGLQGDPGAVRIYQDWFQRAVDQLPSVHHYSWYDIASKIRQYKLHWGAFWKSQYRIDSEDTAENNVMFDKPWTDVTDDEINELAQKLASELGGWIFHEKVDFSKNVPHIRITRDHPAVFLDNNE